ncbi:MAG TPA: FAD-binding protein, partial [bacterium]|nr:FAD-binding protein [bacterium]
MLKPIFSKLSEQFKESIINYDFYMKDYSSMRVGGRPVALIKIDNFYDLLLTLEYFNQERKELSPLIIGKSTNLIFSDNIRNYVVIILGENFNKIIQKDNQLLCSAATPLQQVVRKSAELGLSGLEWAIGIPGAISGAIVNNCGSKENDISELISEITVIDYAGKKRKLQAADLKPRYRNTIIKETKKYIIIEALLNFEKKDRIEILETLNKNFYEKQNNQPLNECSAGCIFKNPSGYSAGKLIDDCGLKGYSIGG